MPTDLLDRLIGSMYHRILHLLGVDIETFHEWLEGFCTCDDAEKQDTAA